MMLRIAALVCVCALAACGTSGPPKSAAERKCDAEAMNDPKVKELVVQSLGNDAKAYELQFDLERARQQATLRCLRAEGLAPPGGVEPVRPDR